MKLLQASKDILLKPLQSVIGVVERRQTLPILANVLVRVDQGKVIFIATDLELQLAANGTVENKTTRTAEFTVSGRKFSDILRSFPDGEQVILESHDNRLTVKAGRSRFQLQTLPVADFPTMGEVSSPVTALRFSQAQFKRMLEQVNYSMAQQDIRYYLNGLLLAIEQIELRLVATDGHRLAMVTDSIAPQETSQEVILPRKAIQELVKLLKDEDIPMEVALMGNLLKAEFSGITLLTKLIDGKFPDYQRVIPVGYTNQFDVSRKELLSALQRVSILSTDKFRGVRWVVTKDVLTIASTNADQEEAQEELPIQYDGAALDIGFNVDYLMDVLQHGASEFVHCSLGDANSSMLVTHVDSPTFRYVVMPMRI